MNTKLTILLTSLCMAISSIFNFAYSQEAPTQEQGFEKPKSELRELSEKQKKELDALKQKQREEKVAQREKLRKEKEESRKKRQEEKQEKRNIDKKSLEESRKNRTVARAQVKERVKIIKKAKKTDRLIDVSSKEDDPIYIINAEVLKTKTEFLKLKDVEFTYQVKLQNQTPKIVNQVLIVWERRLPFTDSFTISKETKIAKPLIPYEERIVNFNELDSKREGETYSVKVARVVFEDGTQWKNPLFKNTKI